jgi:hypothetical protein
MSGLDFPQKQLPAVQDLANRLLDSRKPRADNEAFARSLLTGFFDICMHSGLDRLLFDLAEAKPPLDVSDSSGLANHPEFLAALVTQLEAADLDGGGPRNAKPRLVVDSLVNALGLTLSEASRGAIVLDDRVRTDVTAAIAGVVDGELALPQLRDTIIAKGRALCEERHYRAYDLIAAQLDARGGNIMKIPKVPVDALHAVQRVLFEARNAVIDRVARAAIDRAKAVIERADPTAAARIDQPITHKLTPRDVAILRACDPRVPKTPPAIVASLVESVTEMARYVWRAPERAVRQYAATQKFAVGDVLEHPKFGRGSVVSCLAQRIEVEFADGKHTLVHAK